MIETGSIAPDFLLNTDTGGEFRLSDHLGTVVVLFFYPEDGTIGCTTEALEFSALGNDFAAHGALLLGISPDHVATHAKFRDANGLSVTLGADPELAVTKAYGLWGPKKMFGVAYDGVIRATVIVGTDGKVAGIIKASRIKGHAETVLKAVIGLTD
ncbi:MAG: bcp 2 [Devosia sp.]|nr:bcp 2 [Devosia sp.]